MQLGTFSFDNDDTIVVKKESVTKLSDVYQRFVQNKGIDVIKCVHEDGVRKIKRTRAEVKTLAAYHRANDKEELCQQIIKAVSDTPKQVSKWATEILQVKLPKDPFELLQYATKSSVQERMERDYDRIHRYGSFAYSCSCGAGKTIAGINLIYKLKVKTLIVSSRNAVNDQWKTQLQTLYPFLNICCDGDDLAADIYILTPKYLANRVKTFRQKIGLIIYDEVHSQLSDVFIQALLLPYLMVLDGRLPELPYMIALSATYPNPTTLSYKHFLRMFGQPAKCPATITSIPVHIHDYYDHYTPNAREGSRHRCFDMFYTTLSDLEAVEDACNMIDKGCGIDVYDPKYCGIVMTYSILTSIQAAKYLHERYNVNILIVRTVDQPTVLLKKDTTYDYSSIWQLMPKESEATDEDDGRFDTKLLLSNNVGEKYDYFSKGFAGISIVVSTVQRVKEGFSIQNAIWGICTKFVWSPISRVQILGRIRRNSTDPELNSKRRLMLCYSAKRPSNAGIPGNRRKGPLKWTYDMSYEETLFAAENYVRI
jgi:hypothetical protein